MVGYILSRGVSNPRDSSSVLKMLIRLRELSFAMGRPSCLGSDEYHNLDFPLTEFSELFDPHSPLLDPPHCAVIEQMVHISRLTRHVCVTLYLPQIPAARTVELAHQLDPSLDAWLSHLPECIRPMERPEQAPRLGNIREAIWMKRQKLVLNLRECQLGIGMFW